MMILSAYLSVIRLKPNRSVRVSRHSVTETKPFITFLRNSTKIYVTRS